MASNASATTRSSRHWEPFLPCGKITGIGSLPMKDVSTAIQFVAKYSPDIPFWPQLPQVSEREGVIRQGLEAIGDLIELRSGSYGYEVKPGKLDLVVDRLQNDRDEFDRFQPAGFQAFEQAFAENAFPKAVAVKGQIEGPITLASYLFDRDRPFVSDPCLFDAVSLHVARRTRWQVHRLRSVNLPVLLFVDEPALCIGASVQPMASEERLIFALSKCLEVIRNAGAVAGLHCCAAHPFTRMCRSNPDILSFDAHHGLELFPRDAAVRKFVEGGGFVAYGLIPTWSSLKGLRAEAVFGRWLRLAAEFDDPADIALRSMVTATCGLGLLDEGAARESFELCRQVGDLIRKVAGNEFSIELP